MDVIKILSNSNKIIQKFPSLGFSFKNLFRRYLVQLRKLYQLTQLNLKMNRNYVKETT